MTVNGHTITFKPGTAPAGTLFPPAPASSAMSLPTATATPSIYLGITGTPTATVADLMTAIDLASGVQKAVINASTGAATFANASGTNGAIAGGIVP